MQPRTTHADCGTVDFRLALMGPAALDGCVVMAGAGMEVTGGGDGGVAFGGCGAGATTFFTAWGWGILAGCGAGTVAA